MDTKISIIIPTLNEEANVESLVFRLDEALKKNDISYELIFIDDHSSDGTLNELDKLKPRFPLNYWPKEGSQGKAFSLLEGFSRASSEILAMIDADLQYPPEAIPEMAEKVMKGEADIVVADRVKRNETLLRTFVSKGFALFVGKMLCGLDCDAQSGLKVFRKPVLDSISLYPSKWSFDLEFLYKAKEAGFGIASVPIDFEARKYGASKLHLVSSSIEIGGRAMHLRFGRRRY